MELLYLLLCVLISLREGSQLSTLLTDPEYLAMGINNFAEEFHQKIASNSSNIVFSPLSIHMALSMTEYGARGDTETELLSALNLRLFANNRRLNISRAYHDIIAQVESHSKVTISIANAMYINPSFPIVKNYKSDLVNYYHAEVDNLDFMSPDGPELKINEFVQEHTAGRIENIVPTGTIGPNTALVLVNAVFFKGEFQRLFNKRKTRPRPFYKGDAVIELNTMRDKRHINIKRNVAGADVAELKFVDPRYSLYFVVPRDKNGLAEFERSLATTNTPNLLFTNLESKYVELMIPKFNIETSLKLKPHLQELGIRQAFDVNSANFEGITKTAGLYISEVLHKATIEVTETGTVASAATAVLVEPKSFLPTQGTFIVDRPFLVYLRDNVSGYTMFQAAFRG